MARVLSFHNSQSPVALISQVTYKERRLFCHLRINWSRFFPEPLRSVQYFGETFSYHFYTFSSRVMWAE